jgi:hypothetical protein
MTEFDFTRGTKVLTLATINLIVSWITSFIYYPRSSSIILTLISAFFSAIATYAAAKGMNMPLFLSQYWAATQGKTSASFTSSLVASSLVLFNVFIWITVWDQASSNLMDTIALILAIIGGILVSYGGIIAHKEWKM